MHEPAVHERYFDRELVQSDMSHQFITLRVNDEIHAQISPAVKPARLIEGTEVFLPLHRDQRVDQQHTIDSMVAYIKKVQRPEDKCDVYVYRLKDDGTVYGIFGATSEPTPIKFNEAAEDAADVAEAERRLNDEGDKAPPFVRTTPGPGHVVDEKGGLQAHATPLPNYPMVSFIDDESILACSLNDGDAPAEPDFGFGDWVDTTPVWFKIVCGLVILFVAISMVILMAHIVGTTPPATN